ncbi:MAG: hypothetical protein AVDCRST_MAG95-1164 [uncultured Adhaeribacter sp.]|uniref:Inositolphosphotransferase Aur1/Ipt1 domain-containing protein n=1 Tax=uncultured Adhaeribacter sp. TaxID=448109 RepID=A0A6J4HWA7_9BACT|nr:MAG: hypothetical protein AVDCRST_MAG95-1164 [uncultured Adhaeribacter sp.]
MSIIVAKAREKTSVSRKSFLIVMALSVGYLLLSYGLVGFKSDQLILVGLVNLLYFLSDVTRKFITGFSIFIVFWILFDYMKAFPNYWFNPVHIQDLYNAEKLFFGIKSGSITLTPNEFWLQYRTTFLDVLSGIFYLTWVPIPLAFASFLFFKNRQQFVYFALTFLLINLLGWVIYYAYPAAPPWYVQQHGFRLVTNTPGNTAGLARFDGFFHTNLFQSIYAKSSNVFAAMPSLHAAYPLLVFYYAIKNRLGSVGILFGIIMAGIWFAAVYTSHHYVLDVLAGIICAVCGILVFNWFMRQKGFVCRLVNKLVAAIR